MYGLAVIIGIGVAIWYWGFDTLWYAAEYWVPPDAVRVVARPTDCDFWRSPMGKKGCHYDRAVRVYLSTHDIYDAQTGRVSDFQTGVESNLDPKAQFASVLVFWTKKDDE